MKEFVKIKGGEFELEGLGKNDIKSFEIGKYPVTNQWYQEFIENGRGYDNKEFWTPHGWKWLKDNKVRYPSLWHDRKWNCPNAPVVGVCWYEAVAFCKWLTVSLDDGYNYELPTEEKWQVVAAGKQGCKYPWGDWEDGRCNYKKAGIAKTSPVGIFAKGKTPDTEIFDLSGNVWEWTKTKYDTKENRDDFVVDERLGKGPVLLGGSWDDDDRVELRCACRFIFNPDVRSFFIGFRCARTKK